MKAVILGATRGMGRALARLMAQRGARLFVLGLGEAELEKSAADLKLHGASDEVGSALCDLERPDDFAAVLDRAEQHLDGFDTVVLTAADFETQDVLEAETERARRLLTINFVNTIVFCEHARQRLLQQGGGTLCVFSSVAGERARKPVYIYGSAKAGLSHYLEGLDHKYRKEGLQTICVKPGFVKTGMTAGLPTPPFAGEPDQVAADVLRAIQRGSPVTYSPKIWGLVMLVIRNLPRVVMRSIKF